MGLVLVITAGLIAWIVLWALGATGFDGFLVTILVSVVGATAHLLTPYLPGRNK